MIILKIKLLPHFAACVIGKSSSKFPHLLCAPNQDSLYFSTTSFKILFLLGSFRIESQFLYSSSSSSNTMIPISIQKARNKIKEIESQHSIESLKDN